MRVLAFDASTELLAVAVGTPRASFSCVQDSGSGHAERLVPLIESALERCTIAARDLDLVVCAKGPGSFTGLRIAMATAKGISAGSGAPLVTVPTLDYLSMPFRDPRETAVPIVDARKGRVYSGLYRSGSLLGDYLDLPLQDLLSRLEGEERVVFTGPDASLAEETALSRPSWRIDPLCRRPRPDLLLELGREAFATRGPDSPGSSPLYIRESEEDLGITRPRSVAGGA